MTSSESVPMGVPADRPGSMDGGPGRPAEDPLAPAGVRPAPGHRAEGTVHAGTRSLCWVQPGPFALEQGDRVVVREGDAEWVGEVVVPPNRLIEWPMPGEWPHPAARPVIVRRAADEAWPVPPVTAGRRLLESLALPPELLARE